MMQHEETKTDYDSSPPPSGQSERAVTCHPEYVRTLPGILKVSEVLLSMLTFICGLVGSWNGQGWVNFVAISCFLTTLIYLICLMVTVYGRVYKPWPLWSFIAYCIMTLFFFIAAIVAAAYASRRTSVVFCAVFAFAATGVYSLDLYFQYKTWRQEGNTTNTTTTTTTTTTSEVA